LVGTEAEISSLRASLSEQMQLAAAHQDSGAQLEKTKEASESLVAETELLKGKAEAASASSVNAQSELTEALSDARSAAAKWEQELTLQKQARDTLVEEVAALKLEAKELTDAHAKEVERLQERLVSLCHDTAFLIWQVERLQERLVSLERVRGGHSHGARRALVRCVDGLTRVRCTTSSTSPSPRRRPSSRRPPRTGARTSRPR
jgi:chromosome segregation ATPase